MVKIAAADEHRCCTGFPKPGDVRALAWHYDEFKALFDWANVFLSSGPGLNRFGAALVAERVFASADP